MEVMQGSYQKAFHIGKCISMTILRDESRNWLVLMKLGCPEDILKSGRWASIVLLSLICQYDDELVNTQVISLFQSIYRIMESLWLTLEDTSGSSNFNEAVAIADIGEYSKLITDNTLQLTVNVSSNSVFLRDVLVFILVNLKASQFRVLVLLRFDAICEITAAPHLPHCHIVPQRIHEWKR